MGYHAQVDPGRFDPQATGERRCALAGHRQEGDARAGGNLSLAAETATNFDVGLARPGTDKMTYLGGPIRCSRTSEAPVDRSKLIPHPPQAT